MKRNLLVCLVLLLCMSLAFVSCTDNANTTEPTTESTPPATQEAEDPNAPTDAQTQAILDAFNTTDWQALFASAEEALGAIDALPEDTSADFTASLELTQGESTSQLLLMSLGGLFHLSNPNENGLPQELFLIPDSSGFFPIFTKAENGAWTLAYLDLSSGEIYPEEDLGWDEDVFDEDIYDEDFDEDFEDDVYDDIYDDEMLYPSFDPAILKEIVIPSITAEDVKWENGMYVLQNSYLIKLLLGNADLIGEMMQGEAFTPKEKLEMATSFRQTLEMLGLEIGFQATETALTRLRIQMKPADEMPIFESFTIDFCLTDDATNFQSLEITLAAFPINDYHPVQTISLINQFDDADHPDKPTSLHVNAHLIAEEFDWSEENEDVCIYLYRETELCAVIEYERYTNGTPLASLNIFSHVEYAIMCDISTIEMAQTVLDVSGEPYFLVNLTLLDVDEESISLSGGFFFGTKEQQARGEGVFRFTVEILPDAPTEFPTVPDEVLEYLSTYVE